MSILVTYATAHGTTREIAELIAERIRVKVAPTQVDCIPVVAVPKLQTIPQQYSTIIVGSAIHIQRWISPGRRFINRNAAFLNGEVGKKYQKQQGGPEPAPPRVWAFSVGGVDTEEKRRDEEAMVDKQLRARLTGDTLRGHRLFMGRIEKDHLGWFFLIS